MTRSLRNQHGSTDQNKGISINRRKDLSIWTNNKKIVENGEAGLIDRLDRVEYIQKNITAAHYVKPKIRRAVSLEGVRKSDLIV